MKKLVQIRWIEIGKGFMLIGSVAGPVRVYDVLAPAFRNPNFVPPLGFNESISYATDAMVVQK